MQSLGKLGFDITEIEPGTVYRNLRRLEEEGSVSSHWDTEGGGPAKRLYCLTSEGEELLHAWALNIRQSKERLETFLSQYERQF
jgi:poly-beta-hydroxybutyrate-responsive repressor